MIQQKPASYVDRPAAGRAKPAGGQIKALRNLYIGSHVITAAKPEHATRFCGQRMASKEKAEWKPDQNNQPPPEESS